VTGMMTFTSVGVLTLGKGVELGDAGYERGSAARAVKGVSRNRTDVMVLTGVGVFTFLIGRAEKGAWSKRGAAVLTGAAQAHVAEVGAGSGQRNGERGESWTWRVSGGERRENQGADGGRGSGVVYPVRDSGVFIWEGARIRGREGVADLVSDQRTRRVLKTRTGLRFQCDWDEERRTTVSGFRSSKTEGNLALGVKTVVGCGGVLGDP